MGLWPGLDQDHPHLRGEHESNQALPDGMPGSPPPAWGAHMDNGVSQDSMRITPTCVGSTPVRRFKQACGRDHPHLRGEHVDPDSINWGIEGSPPPAWGALKLKFQPQLKTRITPTCVGSTSTGQTSTKTKEDHPHLRGEHSRKTIAKIQKVGSPPPAWGARYIRLHATIKERITPTCVGSTLCGVLAMHAGGDHPHLRGEHCFFSKNATAAKGSPPPAWGALICIVCPL